VRWQHRVDPYYGLLMAKRLRPQTLNDYRLRQVDSVDSPMKYSTHP